MKRNCNLELRLVTPSVFSHSSNYINIGQCNSMLDLFGERPNEKQQQQPLTIFYNGRVAVSDVTELQARAIIKLASRENEEKSTSSNEPQLYSPVSGLSMKRSLQRFLQKRKTRAEATSPYPAPPFN
ncbi:hypothetical protein ACJIZ3_013378 [Penstemon smallii]|uniref:Protein TIFY n=1 Tax=Penstemon smallii TaxID=265156 RepID=A0ABD3UPP0_9LAMI